MFDKKSDYALNKRMSNAIVYISVTGVPVLLTRDDFASEEEFLRWKLWSDSNYQRTEHDGRDFYDNCIPLDDRLDGIGAVASAEDGVLNRLADTRRARARAGLLEQLRKRLTKTQYRRLWLYCVNGMTIGAIAIAEGVTHQNVSKSITQAKKKVERILLEQGAKPHDFL